MALKRSIGNAKYVSLDDVCTLVSITYTKDELGQQIKQETERQVFCTLLSINRYEFSAAGQLGLKPKIMLIIHNDEYEGETKIKYNNKNYQVYKDFARSDGFVELYCGVKVGG